MLICVPTTDVHLLTAAGRDQAIDLHVFAMWPPESATATWTDLSTVPDLRIEHRPVTHAAVAISDHVTGSPTPIAGAVFTVHPIAVGSHIVQTLVNHPTVTGLGIAAVRTLRVTVHADVDRFWISVATITMFAGETNCLVPITAIYDDASQADATSHPYWTYTSSNPAVATVDADGRVRALTAGTATLTVTLRGTQNAQTVPLTVMPALADGHTATIMPWGSVAGDRARVYVISEGYTDKSRFEDHFKEVAKQWFESAQNQPFKMLRDRFAVFGIFDPVGKQGITIGPVLDSQSLAEPATLTTAAELTGPLRITDERDTRFGLMYGARLGDPVMRAQPASIAAWLRPARAHRSVSVDWRRLPDVHADPGAAFMDYLRRYLEAVAAKATGQPDGFGTLTEHDRVLLLCDDQMRGGLLLAVFTNILPGRSVVSATCGPDPGFANVAASPSEARRFDRTTSYTFIRAAVASTAVHEIGHSYRLHDEYESQRGAAAATSATIAALEPYENVQAIHELVDTTTGDIVTKHIKWNLPRVVHAARVTAIVVSNLKVAMTIPGASKLAWIAAGKKLWLRPTLRTPRSAPSTPRLELFEVTITSVSGDTVMTTSVFAVPEPSFAGGGVLYDPLMSTGGIEKLLHSAVALHVAGNGAFPKPAARSSGATSPCTDQDPAAVNEAVDAPAITGGPTTADRWRIIGLYEGGFDVSCGIARPSGRCKLRQAFDFKKKTVWQFCHVCQYVIVDLVDPGVHATLDKDYP